MVVADPQPGTAITTACVPPIEGSPGKLYCTVDVPGATVTVWLSAPAVRVTVPGCPMLLVTVAVPLTV